MSRSRRVLLVTPAPPGANRGNGISARRWARWLREAGHEVELANALDAEEPDVLVALHARKSAEAVARLRERAPGARIVVVLTGTDLYRDLPAGDAAARRSLDLADRIVVLHPGAVADVPEDVRHRVRVIVQSAEPPRDAAPRRWSGPADGPLRVCVSGHLRAVKDPFRTAAALESLPPETGLVVTHAGGVLEPGMEAKARRYERDVPRYRFVGEVPHEEALRLLAGSDLLVISSLLEGAPNVLSEALALGTGVLATEIPGCVGILGADHPGLFPPGATGALARLLARAAGDPRFLRLLADRSAALADLVRPEREREAWRGLIAELNAPRTNV